MADYFDAGKHGTIVALAFYQTNQDTAGSNADMLVAGQASGTLYTMPCAGSVIGLSVNGSAAVTVSTATFRAHKDGTEFAETGYPAPVLSTTNTTKSYAVIRPGAITFAAGDGLGVSIVTTTTYSPTTIDHNAILWVQLDPA